MQVMPQGKLLTPEEAAQRLNISGEELEALVLAGRLTAYRLGGQFVRFRAEEIERSRARASAPVGRIHRSASTLETWRDRCREFLYLHDFYLLAAVLTLILIAVLIRFA